MDQGGAEKLTFRDSLCIMCQSWDELLLVKWVFTIDFVQAHGSPIDTLVGASMATTTVIWQVQARNHDVKKERTGNIEHVVQSIALGTYATMKALSGEKHCMNKWR